MAELLFVEAINENPAYIKIYEKLFFERNIKMTNKILSYLKSSESYFVIVGAGHLIGEKGIVRLLEKKGYEVTRK